MKKISFIIIFILILSFNVVQAFDITGMATNFLNNFKKRFSLGKFSYPNQPIGEIEKIDEKNCIITGWAADLDKPNEPIYLNVYVDGDYKKGYLIEKILANQYNEKLCEVKYFNKTIGCNHYFTLNLKDKIVKIPKLEPIPKYERTYRIYIYGINIKGTKGYNSLISKNPITIKCSLSQNMTVNINITATISPLTTPSTQPTPSCGNLGQLCCPLPDGTFRCYQGACINNICTLITATTRPPSTTESKYCGHIGESCCPGNVCYQGYCISGRCVYK
ncbi:MAG: hypothetical protein QXJ06_00480 [Candidatus Aenigmatarchaeota archaeon]